MRPDERTAIGKDREHMVRNLCLILKQQDFSELI